MPAGNVRLDHGNDDDGGAVVEITQRRRCRTRGERRVPATASGSFRLAFGENRLPSAMASRAVSTAGRRAASRSRGARARPTRRGRFPPVRRPATRTRCRRRRDDVQARGRDIESVVEQRQLVPRVNDDAIDSSRRTQRSEHAPLGRRVEVMADDDVSHVVRICASASASGMPTCSPSDSTTSKSRTSAECRSYVRQRRAERTASRRGSAGSSRGDRRRASLRAGGTPDTDEHLGRPHREAMCPRWPTPA